MDHHEVVLGFMEDNTQVVKIHQRAQAVGKHTQQFGQSFVRDNGDGYFRKRALVGMTRDIK